MTPDEGLAPDAFIELVKDRVDLVEFFSAYTTLAKAGSEWKGRCPLHDEKTGSFYLNEVKGVWHCYGCGKGGNLFTFLREKEGLDFRAAADLLSDRYRLPRMGRSRGGGQGQEMESRRRRLADMHQEAATWFQRMLRETRGRPFQHYLRDRAFTKDDVERFGLGAAPDEWEGLTHHLLQRGYKPDELLAAGLALKSPRDERRLYDRFRHRLIIPICDTHGKVIAFGGRIINPEDQPKYLNSPETEIFKKNKTLFALHLAKDAIRKKGWVALMEGYTDVMRAHQRGIPNVVAAMGTALTDEQISELNKFLPGKKPGEPPGEVILVMDADRAGQNAAFRHAANLLRREVPVRVLVMPENQDPDDFLRYAEDPIAAFEERLKYALPAMEYMVRGLVDEYHATSDPQRRGLAVQQALEIANTSPAGAREARANLARKFGMSMEQLEDVARQMKGRPQVVAQQPTPAPSTASQVKLAVADRDVLRAMLSDPSCERLGLQYLAPIDFEPVIAQRLLRELAEGRERGDTSPIQDWPRLQFDPELGQFISELLIGNAPPPSPDMFKRMLTPYRARQVRQQVADVLREMEDAARFGDGDRTRLLLGEKEALGRQLNLLMRHLWPEDQ